jgi:hypothetical protein
MAVNSTTSGKRISNAPEPGNQPREPGEDPKIRGPARNPGYGRTFGPEKERVAGKRTWAPSTSSASKR